MLVRERQHKPLRALHDEDGIRTHACRAQWISSPSPDGNTATHREREGKELDTGEVVAKIASLTMLVRERKQKPLRALPDEDGIRTHACRAQWISSPSPDGNTATHRERECKELDTGDVVPKMASPTMLV